MRALYEYSVRPHITPPSDEAGDKICLFGFSRGAYTACALAGIVDKVGLLARDNHQEISFAYELYKRSDLVGTQEGANYKKKISRTVRIDFIGVW